MSTRATRAMGGYEVTDGAAHVVDGVWQVPRYGVVPEIGSDPAGKLLIAAASGRLAYCAFCLDPGTDPSAAAILTEGLNGHQMLRPGDTKEIALAADGSDGELQDVPHGPPRSGPIIRMRKSVTSFRP